MLEGTKPSREDSKGPPGAPLENKVQALVLKALELPQPQLPCQTSLMGCK